MSRFPLSLLLSGACVVNVSLAQTPAGLAEGQRVRLGIRCKVSHEQVSDCRHKRSPDQINGELTSMTGDSIRIRTSSDHAELAVPKSAVAQAWVADGTRGQFMEGAAVGLLGGVLLGAAVGSTQETCMLECAPSTEFGAIGGAVIGFLLGGVVGSQIHTERWREIEHAKLSVTPRGRGVGIGMSLAF